MILAPQHVRRRHAGEAAEILFAQNPDRRLLLRVQFLGTLELVALSRDPLGTSAVTPASWTIDSRSWGGGPNPSAPITSIVVFALTSSAVVPPSRATNARASLRPSELSFPVKTTRCPASDCGRSGEGAGNQPPRRWAEGTASKMKDNGAQVKSESLTMLIAGDIGGTKTLLGLFERAAARPQPIAVRSFGTLDYDDLTTMITTFLDDDAAARTATIETACFGVAGPVIGDSATMTNIPWRIDGQRVRSQLGFRVKLLNDLEAMAYSIPVLQPDEVHVLQEGEAIAGGNIALIAAGTGLGEALLHHVDGRYIASPTEAGHADFGARTERELQLVRDLTPRFGRVDVERVISGRGLLVVHSFTHTKPCEAGVDLEDPDAAALISRAALDRRCPGCVEALDLFVEAYGAETETSRCAAERPAACSSAAALRRKFCRRSPPGRSCGHSTPRNRSSEWCSAYR